MFGVDIHASEVCILQLCSDLGMISNLYEFVGIEYQVSSEGFNWWSWFFAVYFTMLDVNWFDVSDKKPLATINYSITRDCFEQ